MEFWSVVSDYEVSDGDGPKYGLAICDLNPCAWSMDRSGDAALIAAAPDLLVALKELYRNEDKELHTTQEQMERAKKAIEKAEGQF